MWCARQDKELHNNKESAFISSSSRLSVNSSSMCLLRSRSWCILRYLIGALRVHAGQNGEAAGRKQSSLTVPLTRYEIRCDPE